MSETVLNGTPHKNKRRTKAELETLDAALYELVNEHKPCTVRQIYYRAVVGYLCPKDDSGYNLVQRRLLKLRRGGVLPYGWITDNARSIYGHTRYTDLTEFAQYAASLYRRDFWNSQDVNVEIWCESDSIAGTIHNAVVNEWCLDLHVARGFSSETYLFNAGQSIKNSGKKTYIYTLSDFDPSGISLADDIDKKLHKFCGDVEIEVSRIALDLQQILEWQLPTHDLKKTDRRAKAFIESYADFACELEAIPPQTLRELVGARIASHADTYEFRRLEMIEQQERESIEAVWGNL